MEKIKLMFKAFGEIKSYHFMKNQFGLLAFVSYYDPTGVNKEYGSECAQKAIEGINGKELRGIPYGQKLYAIEKSDREVRREI